MRVLHVVPTFWPATFWGGPVFSTKAICDAVHGGGIAVEVLTTDAAGPRRGDRLPAGAGDALPYPVRYAARRAGVSVAPGLLARLPRAVARADVVHLTGTFSFPTLPALRIARALGRPLVWSPRGAIQALAEWDASPRKAPKRAFLRLAAAAAPRRTVLHATAAEEARASAPFVPRARVEVVPNSVPLPPRLPPRVPAPGRMRLLFVSRLHRKKGLDMLIEAMRTLPPEVTLDVHGTGEADHAAEVAAMARTLPGRVRLHGHLADAEKAAAFAAADLFVLPSHSENFGIVVAEALAHGVPVLTTTGTPWAVLEERGCGRRVAPTAAALREAIQVLRGCDLGAMGARGRALARERFSQEALGRRFAALYRELGERP